MSNKYLTYLINIFLLLIAVGCKGNLLGPDPNNLFYPLEIGNSWEYESRYYDSLGVYSYGGTITETIIRDTSENGLMNYEIESPLYRDLGCCDLDYFLQNSHKGVRLLMTSDGKWMTNNILYMYPCAKGDYFIANRRIPDTTFVVSLHDTIACEAGIFDCIVYENHIKDPEYQQIIGLEYKYVAFGIGKIKTEALRYGNEHRLIKASEYILKSYHLE